MEDNVIKTARRLFEVLEHFENVQRPVSLKEISSEFDYPASSASALLKSMVVMGYLDYDGYSRTYMPTMRIASLGNWIGGALFGEGRILALVKHVNEVTEETIAVATQSDLLTQYIHVVASPLELRYHLKPGIVRPLARSGLGWLLLSARSDGAIEKLLRRINVSEPDRDRQVEFADLMAKVREIRAQGYVYSRHTVTLGAGMVGMLIPERRHGRILAIGVLGPIDRLDAKKDLILNEMRAGIDRFFERDVP